MNEQKLEKAVKELQEKMSEQEKLNKITAEIHEIQAEINHENNTTLRNLCVFAILQTVVLFILMIKIFGG